MLFNYKSTAKKKNKITADFLFFRFNCSGMGIGSGLSLHCFHGYMRAVKFDGKIILLKIIDWWKMEIFSKIYDAMMEQETNEDVVKI